MSWVVERLAADPASLHSLLLPAPPVERLVRVCEATSPALVIGSTQPDPGDRGVPVVRRRSGGGAVLVEPGDVVWVDVVVPAGDPLWDDDVGRAFWWLGDAWATALGPGHAVHRGALVASPWSLVVCFAGVGPGEVLDARGRKVVGIAQRRTRHLALFQSAALLAWRPERLGPLVDVPAEELRDVAAPAPSDAGGLVDRLLRALPT